MNVVDHLGVAVSGAAEHSLPLNYDLDIDGKNDNLIIGRSYVKMITINDSILVSEGTQHETVSVNCEVSSTYVISRQSFA